MSVEGLANDHRVGRGFPMCLEGHSRQVGIWPVGYGFVTDVDFQFAMWEAFLEQKRNTTMAASSWFMIAEAERRFPVRIRIAVPPAGLGGRLDQIKAWLDENTGANGWAMTPSGTRGVLNDAASIYFADVALAGAFVALVRGLQS